MIAVDNQLGKPAGQDLAEGIYNLPTLVALRDDRVGEELRSVLGSPLDDAERERARKLVVASGGVEATIEAAQGFFAAADQALSVVPSAALREGFTSFLASMLEDFPAF